ncbi:hypothetical protein TWF730_009313 [Orbilia blumenaviensis]|uniref:Uncharacterized protein n=1 Tax=Orbilia blumenaviensis TaxID=1796055 RepID=A0AAV9UY76_9PEZI
MFANERPMKRRRPGMLGTTAEEDGCEWEEERADTPDPMVGLEAETDWERDVIKANEADEVRRQQASGQGKDETEVKIKSEDYDFMGRL